MEGSPKVIVMKVLWMNKRISGNNIKKTYSIVCTTDDIVKETMALLEEAQPYTVGNREGIPDELNERINHSPIRNLWKLSRQLDDDCALLKVKLKHERPTEGIDDEETTVPYNLVFVHTAVYSYGGGGW